MLQNFLVPLFPNFLQFAGDLVDRLTTSEKFFVPVSSEFVEFLTEVLNSLPAFCFPFSSDAIADVGTIGVLVVVDDVDE